ncbi:hypothetical protein Poli38472_006996 [Pythium oligandrum]|uniref:NADP-dependent oxidoreductase domain-containing protein n=1 Tax=Pythium oligandrum TaxID=41045 RepID=A0A8K1C8W9_PYTOL|nr:hypothetical protein Poli38472_006996 [Pythium oligandrum]|eukprot:TMW58851.1 hypothetical protein Poli38472_006996 [Pythium oligandrum]
MNLEYVDVVLCHRWDKHTPVEETVRALDYIVNQGWALYWGTSNWISSEILEAFAVADRLRLIRPIAEQPEYNTLQRSAVELDYYKDGIPDGSRMADPVNQQIVRGLADRVAKTEKLRPIAKELGCSLAQLAIAWCLTNGNVSTVIVGASSVKQLDENLEALSVAAKITKDVKARIDAVIQPKLRVLEQDFLAGMRAKYLIQRGIPQARQVLRWLDRRHGPPIRNNPDITGNAGHKDGDNKNEVRAIDVDADLKSDSGVTMEDVVQYMLTKMRGGTYMPFRYLIFNKRIWSKSNNWEQQAYTGSSPHTERLHISGDYGTAVH